MPIPAFDGILNILPPHLGQNGRVENLSPYLCTTKEVCERFAGSAERVAILRGVLQLRASLIKLGVKGFQWLDGSFVEDVETHEHRAPGDVDVVTFADDDPVSLVGKLSANVNLLDRMHVKKAYHVDHFWLPLGSHPVAIVEQTRYWYGLFSHRRDRTWKGMLVTKISESDDAEALKILESKA